MNKKVHFQNLGLIDYKKAWDYQEEIFKKTIDLKLRKTREDATIETPNNLLFVEHPHVFTLGKSGDKSHLLTSEKELNSKGVTFHKINRGGDITYHGPGQIVGYPILDLDNFFTDIHKYLRLLEEMVILTLAEYNITATRSKGETGVWIEANSPFARKICAMGVRASRWVTMHGFALNVNTDLGYFDHIIPCGIKGKGVTSIHAELGEKIPLFDIQKKLLKHFETLFEAQLLMNKTHL